MSNNLWLVWVFSSSNFEPIIKNSSSDAECELGIRVNFTWYYGIVINELS